MIKKLLVLLILIISCNTYSQEPPPNYASKILSMRNPKEMENIIKFAVNKWGDMDKGVIDYEVEKQSYSYMKLLIMSGDTSLNRRQQRIIIMEISKYMDNDDEPLVDWFNVLRETRTKLKK